MRVFACFITALLLSLCDLSVTLPEGKFLCDHDSDCRPNECCSKIPRFMVVGKREEPVTFTSGPIMVQPISPYLSSSCQPYLGVNATCANLYKANGDCGCAPNLVCRYYPELDPYMNPWLHAVTILPQPQLSRAIPGNPDAHKCSPKQ